MLPPYLDMHRKFWKQITHWPLLSIVSPKRQGCYSLPFLGPVWSHVPQSCVQGLWNSHCSVSPNETGSGTSPNPWPESCSEGRRELVEIYQWKYWSSSWHSLSRNPIRGLVLRKGKGTGGRGKEHWRAWIWEPSRLQAPAWPLTTSVSLINVLSLSLPMYKMG